MTIGSTSLFGDALLTVDGSLRLYVGGPYESTGALQLDKPDGSAQFVGEVSAQGRQVSGSGMVIGQRCASPASDRFCDEPAPAEVRLTVASDEARGEIEVTTRKGVETWTLNLRAWSNYYALPARREDISGQFQEDLAEFAQDGDTILSIDDAGQLFFQSAGSGCTGNGIASPHLDGNVNVYEVALTIASCDAPYTHLNGEFGGLVNDNAWQLLGLRLVSPCLAVDQRPECAASGHNHAGCPQVGQRARARIIRGQEPFAPSPLRTTRNTWRMAGAPASLGVK